ncbi:hypothetical protein [Streptomyces sp. NPDC054849]
MSETKPRTLLDLYEARPLTDAQVRRIVALLGLAQPRPHDAEQDREAA